MGGSTGFTARTWCRKRWSLLTRSTRSISPEPQEQEDRMTTAAVEPERNSAELEGAQLEGAQLEGAMRHAIDLASRGPATGENPQVGCVLLDAAGAIVAEGWHRGVGTAHAEV